MAKLKGASLTNEEIAKLLKEMSLYHQMQGTAFKPQAYERASWSVAALDRPLGAIYEDGGLKAIQAVESVGKGIAQRLEELLKTGKMKDLEQMRRDVPVDIFGLMAIEGIGAKKVKALYEGLGITNVEELAQAAREEKVRELEGFGKKSEEKILRHMELLEQTQGRWPIGEVLDIATDIRDELRELGYVEQAEVAGSMRRFRETIGDIDILAVSREPAAVMDYFAEMPGVGEVFSKGETKTMVRLSVGLDADLRVVSAESFGAALLYFTGSKHHNIVLRQLAIKKGWKLNEYGLFEDDDLVAGATEEDVYAALELPWFPPEIREDHGEFQAAAEGELPALLEAKDLTGDPHVQSKRGDGENTVLEMAKAAGKRGLKWIGVADDGLDADALAEQADEVAAAHEKSKVRVLHGVAVGIDESGEPKLDGLDLGNLDYVGAFVDGSYELSRQAQTKRLVATLEHPEVDVLFAPTARLFKQREPINVDMETLVGAAAETGALLELNGEPERLDLKDEHVRMAVEGGAGLIVTSNARSTVTLRYATDFGVHVARRGWATPEHVANTLPAKKFVARLKRNR